MVSVLSRFSPGVAPGTAAGAAWGPIPVPTVSVLSRFSPGISRLCNVVFVEVITLPSPEEAGAKIASLGGAVGMGFFLLFGVFFLGTLLAFTVFHSSGIV